MRTGLSIEVGVAAFALALATTPAAHAGEAVAGAGEAAGRYAEALADYDALIQRSPRDPAGYLARGRLNLILGKAGAAAADLRQAVRLKPNDPYGVLWLHYARNKESAPDAMELQVNAERADRAAWPGPLLDYLTGKIDATTALAKAGEGDDKAKANRLCEADLFLGQEQLTKGRRSEGLERLQAAADSCDGPSREAQLARADLPGGAQPQAPPKPVLTQVSNRMPKAALLAEPAVDPASIKPASIRPAAVKPQAQPQVLAQVQMGPVRGDPLLRGSLR